VKRQQKNIYSPQQVLNFFERSDLLDRFVLRPLSHIAPNWDLAWDPQLCRYELEADSFAGDLNFIIEEISQTKRPARYHDHEDTLAEATVRELNWPIQNKNGKWIGADYQSILEQGAFNDIGQKDLIASATGRVHAAMDFSQMHFDEMEIGHLNMLAALMTIAIFHRDCSGESLLYS
jgi:hypothetical protein